MKWMISIFLTGLLVFSSGCFKHAETPYRPITATSMADAIEKRDTVACVNLAGQSLTRLPAELATMPRLSMLWLRGAQGLSSLSGLAELQTLKRLDLSATALSNAPMEVFKLPALEHLYLTDNGMQTLPAAVSGLSSLTYLNLDRNHLTTLAP